MNITKIFLLAFVIVAYSNISSNTYASQAPSTYDVYVPSGLKEGEKVNVYIKGYLPNSCHSYPEIISDFVGTDIYLELNIGSTDSGVFCLQAITPFYHAVDLGEFKAGEYNLRYQKNSEEIITKFRVLDSSEILAQEDDLSDQVRVNSLHVIDGETLEIEGDKQSFCYDIERIDWTFNGNNTYTGRAVVEKTQGFCPKKMERFNKEVSLPKSVKDGDLIYFINSDGSKVKHFF